MQIFASRKLSNMRFFFTNVNSSCSVFEFVLFDTMTANRVTVLVFSVFLLSAFSVGFQILNKLVYVE
jgi:hypothetical protein